MRTVWKWNVRLLVLPVLISHSLQMYEICECPLLSPSGLFHMIHGESYTGICCATVTLEVFNAALSWLRAHLVYDWPFLPHKCGTV